MLSRDLRALAAALASLRASSGRLSLGAASAAWLLVMLDALACTAASLEGVAVDNTSPGTTGGRSPHLSSAGEAGGRSADLGSAGEVRP